MSRIIIFTLAITVIIPASAFCWTSTELFTLKYGLAENEIFVTEKTHNYPDSTNDTGDRWTEPAMGPRIVFVDNAENIIFTDPLQCQLKCFSNEGQLLFDYSFGSAQYNQEFFGEIPNNVYVDSDFNMYLQSDWGTGYIAKLNYQGEILDKIKPYSQDPNAYIHMMNWAPDGTLFFYNINYEWITYENGEVSPGGTSGFKANNGSYYAVKKATLSSLEFIRYENPDPTGLGESSETTEVEIDTDALVYVLLLNGGDGNNLYVRLAIEERHNFEIWQFDLEYNVIDKLTLTNEPAYQDLRILPFVRSDGNIYEFLFREDGLHIIRWSKK